MSRAHAYDEDVGWVRELGNLDSEGGGDVSVRGEAESKGDFSLLIFCGGISWWVRT